MTREINALFRDVPCRPIATSTITGMRARGAVLGNAALQMLLWLERTPESFVPGHPLANAAQARLKRPRPDRILRFDAEKLRAAIESKPARHGRTWAHAAAEIGGVWWNASTLRNLTKTGTASFPSIMRVTSWLERPVAAFTIPSAR